MPQCKRSHVRRVAYIKHAFRSCFRCVSVSQLYNIYLISILLEQAIRLVRVIGVQTTMADFHEKGFAYVKMFDPQIALDAWDDINQYELHKCVSEKTSRSYNVITLPRTPKFIAFLQEVEKVSRCFPQDGSADSWEQNMPLCWERYGKKWMKPERVEQHLDVFAFSGGCSVKNSSHEHIWIWVPLFPTSKNQGLSTFMEGSHRNKGDKADRLYDPVLQPGFALMFDARLRSNVPKVGGDVVLARAYYVTKC